MTIGKQLQGTLIGRRSPSRGQWWHRGSGQTVLGLVQQLQGKFAADPGIKNGDGVYCLSTLSEVQ
jgi:hypothetical protein